MIARRWSWLVVACVVCCGELFAQQADATPERRPNVLLLLADDLRADVLATFGGRDFPTPNLDALAARGAALSRVYCMGSRHGAVCAPSRAMLMSGRMLTRVTDQLTDALDERHAAVRTLPEQLRAVGYATFTTGKWHNGDESLRRAFPDARAVFRGGMCDHFQVPLCDVVGGEVKHERTSARHSSELFADAAIDFLRRHHAAGEAQPFFAYVPFTAPHDPRDPPQRSRDALSDREPPPLPPNFRGQHGLNLGDQTMTVRDENLLGWPRDPDEVRAQLADYRALVVHLDEQIGRILATLDELGLRDDTLIVFTSDHGLALGSHGLLGKQSLYEHSMRSPCIVAGPGVPAGARRDGLTYLYDLTATIAEAAGAEPLPDSDGRSVWPMLRDGAAGRDELLLVYAKTQRALLTAQWKLLRLPQIDRTLLFDVAADPHELHDLAGATGSDVAAIEKSFGERLRAAQQRCRDELPWTTDKQLPVELDLAGKRWPPDRWQPAWIRERYFPNAGK